MPQQAFLEAMIDGAFVDASAVVSYREQQPLPISWLAGDGLISWNCFFGQLLRPNSGCLSCLNILALNTVSPTFNG